MKKIIVITTLFLSFYNYSQEKKGDFFGGFESNSQWYLNDSGLEISHPDYPLRSNNYLFLNYTYKNWAAGIQGESYEDQSLLNYNPKFEGTNVATYFVQFKNNKIDLTAGYFYEQFGSGLIFRGWEDRALGINNALRGGRIIFKPSNSITLKSIYGQQRSGFDVSKGVIYGFDSEFELTKLLKLSTSELSLGFSYVGRDEKIEIENPNFNSLTNAFSGRLNFNHNAFYFNSEYDYKSKDGIIVINSINNDFVKPGNALLLNFGYSKKGLGVDATLRRLENMSFYSQREPDLYTENGGSSSYNYNDKIINYVPGLTKQHHYNLANIYVFQSQPRVDFPDPAILKAGEIGGQIDLFYNFEKGSKLGGKYGTKIGLNISNWNNLSGDYEYFPAKYKVDFFGFGEKYFSDYNLEISKKLTDKWQANFVYINQYYNKKFLEGGVLVKTNILAGDATYKINKSKSVRFQAEHMWADADKKNWASSTIEFNASSKLSFYCSDMYNYGNDDEAKRHHYYNLGGAFRRKSTRISLNYGRQRGGLLCIGGVCRFVPESSGLSLSLNTTF
jgi:Family of unknown function (DUF6029)